MDRVRPYFIIFDVYLFQQFSKIIKRKIINSLLRTRKNLSIGIMMHIIANNTQTVKRDECS